MELEMVTKVKKISSNIEVKMIEVEQRDESEMFTDSPTTTIKETSTTTQITDETTTFATSSTTTSTHFQSSTITSILSSSTETITKRPTTFKHTKPSTIASVKSLALEDGEKPLHEKVYHFISDGYRGKNVFKSKVDEVEKCSTHFCFPWTFLYL